METEESKGDTVIITSSYVDENGRVTVASDKRYAAVRKTVKNGNNILEEYLDESGNPAVLSSGYSSIKREYEDGLCTVITYLGVDGVPVIISSGYEKIKRNYNEHRRADTDTYWIGEKQVQRKQGYWSLKRIYEGKRVISQEYRGENGELVKNSSGYAYFERKYNDAGKVTEIRYFLPDGSPAITSSGYYGYQREYDDQGRVIQTTYLGSDGQPANIYKGYAIEKTEYNDAGTKILYFDTDGKPITGGHSQYGVLKTEEGSTYLNEDGDFLVRLDNLLFSNPAVVLILGIMVMILVMLIKGKWRIIFIILYAAFILYMTIAWRETGTVIRARLDLFWSYRQFFSNRSLQREILQNIWLFVPFGVALCALLQVRLGAGKSVLFAFLICVAFSSVIESVQGIFGIGLCELDDVISNSLGGLIGGIFLYAIGKKQSCV